MVFREFHEGFINTGNVDIVNAMRIYDEVGFEGFFMDDHLMRMFNDTECGHRSGAFANVYIQALAETFARS